MTTPRTFNTARWMITFAKIVEAGGISAAARALGQDKAVTSRQLRDLEASMGLRLLNRSTRHISLTDVGAAMYERALKIVQELDAVRADAEQYLVQPSGVLTLSTSVAFGRLHLIPLLKSFSALYPQVSVELCLLDRHVDLVEEGYDVLLKLCDAPPLNLSAHKVCELQYSLVASEGFLAETGPLQCPADLTRHNCLFYGFRNRRATWNLVKDKVIHPVDVASSLSVNSSEALRDLTLQGVGIALLPTFAIAADVAAGRLQRVLPDYQVSGSLGRGLYLVYMPGRYLPAKTRAFIDFILEQWAPVPPWQRLPSGIESRGPCEQVS
ncbi:LysR family transcriptional regulator [Pseudomonas sp. nanlin1]|uniref:LysR family transcriptional regulator n=1 Tax=Pseudomonas sp. nanlin1 TaxID=3040605 RepID=UPI00389050E0